MIVTTTPGIDGRQVERYLGIVTGEAIIGTNIFRDIFAGIRDIVGGRSATYEKALQEGRDLALQQMNERAQALGEWCIGRPGLQRCTGCLVVKERSGHDASIVAVAMR